jgi:hypothetical protein
VAKPSLARRAARAFLALPAWLRPALLCSGVVLALMSWRVVKAIPDCFAGRGTLKELALALGAAGGAGFVGGLVHGLTRPPLRRLGRPGDYLSGIAMMYGYLGALMLASPYVFEESAIPASWSEGWPWLVLATVVGLAAGQFWFAGPNGIERIQEQRSKPRVQRLADEGGTRTATLISGWIERENLPELLGEVARELGGRLAPGEAQRIDQALAALPAEDEDGLEWRLTERSVLVHLAPDEALVDVDILLEGELERSAQAVHAVFLTRTVDPLTA